jgi:phosphate transport system substrate-binding protein
MNPTKADTGNRPWWGRLTIGFATVLAAMIAAFLLSACGGGNGSSADKSDKQSGSIVGDGSSTVFPITEAVAEEFGKVQPGVKVSVGISGTGGGFKKFCNGETDFNDASRPITDAERQACADKGIQYTEFNIAFDGVVVVTNKKTDFAQCLTVPELKSIWDTGSTVKKWSDVRADWPDKPIKLYGPDTDSGTFDYFTEAINGEAKRSRANYTASADDNVLVQGIEGDENALGYFGFAYYYENKDKLNLLAVDAGKGAGCVLPSHDTILNNTYSPLSRPLFVYVRNDALQQPEVAAFLRYYLTEGRPLISEVGYVPAPDNVYQDDLTKIPQQ